MFNYVLANIDKIVKIIYTPNVDLETNDGFAIIFSNNALSGMSISSKVGIIEANHTYEFKVSKSENTFYYVDHNEHYISMISQDNETQGVMNRTITLRPDNQYVCIGLIAFGNNMVQSAFEDEEDASKLVNATIQVVMLGTETIPQ